MARTQITWFPDDIQRLVTDPSSPLAQIAEREANKLLRSSFQFIGNTYSGHHPERGPLADAGSVERLSSGGFVVAYDHDIALIHHEGAASHSIAPTGRAKTKSGIPIMGRNGPGIVTSWGASKFWTTREVSHPGSPANPFLDKAARQIGWQPAGALKRGTAGPFAIFRSRTVTFTV